MPARLDLLGHRYGRLTVIDADIRRSHWRCRCECGETTVVSTNNLRQGKTRSCGCWRLLFPNALTHGETRGRQSTPEYYAWKGMKSRCSPHPSNRHDWKHYGGKGIRVCDRWASSFETFLADMGRRPSNKHSIDRIDPHGDYSPENCRWATIFEQRRNYSRNVMLTFNGRTLCATDWAPIVGISAAAIMDRVRRGWTVERTLTAPTKRLWRVSVGNITHSARGWARILKIRHTVLAAQFRSAPDPAAIVRRLLRRYGARP